MSLSERTKKLYSRFQKRSAIVKYLKKRRLPKTWARVLAIHSRQVSLDEYRKAAVFGRLVKGVRPAATFTTVKRIHQATVFEYWWRMRFRKPVGLSEFVDTDSAYWSASALQEFASEYAAELRSRWVDVRPAGLRAWFVVELIKTTVTSMGSLGKSRVGVQYALETQCTPRREWTEALSAGLVKELEGFLRNVSDAHPGARVHGIRTHVWISSTMAMRETSKLKRRKSK